MIFTLKYQLIVGRRQGIVNGMYFYRELTVGES